MKKTGMQSGTSDKNKGYDNIDEASAESFPTSDPPAWTLGSNKEIMDAVLSQKNDIAHIIAHEHHVIRHVLSVIKKIIHELENHQTVDANVFKQLNEFFSHYVTHCHYLKEELLFPLLNHGAKHPSDYVLHDLCHEHEATAALLTNLAAAEQHYSPKDTAAREKLIHALKDISHLESNHIAKEEEYILPYISSILTAEEQVSLIDKFNQIDAGLGKNVYEHLSQLADELMKST